MRKFLCCFITAFLFVLFVFGLTVAMEPYLEKREADKIVSQAVSAFREEYPQATQEPPKDENSPDSPTVPSLPEPEIMPELRQYMEEYNENLAASDQYSLIRYEGLDQELIDPVEYGLEDDVIAVISIPELDVEHPIRIGANYNNLDLGFAALSQTSMPIGGESTNCVIAGHRSWRGSAYLRDIEELEVGDKIFIENPWETLVYEVCEIRVVLPYDLDSLLIQEGRDLITLYTCHPFLVSTHRYLVYAERVLPASAKAEDFQSTKPVAKSETTETEAAGTADMPKPTASLNIFQPDGAEFESSEQAIMAEVYGPWCFVVILCLLFLFSLVSTIRYFLRDRKERIHTDA